MTEPQPQSEDEELPETDAAAEAESDAGGKPDIGALDAVALKDQLLRALAEAENTRRRAQKEREDTAKYAVSNFAREMLTVADNFSRALEATPKDSADPALKNLIAGI